MKRPAAQIHQPEQPVENNCEAMQLYLKLQKEKDSWDEEQNGPYTRAHKRTLLDSKLEAYKEQGGRGIEFDQADMKCLYGRWSSYSKTK